MIVLRTGLEHGDAGRVSSRLANGAFVEETFNGWTPLMKASDLGHLAVMDLLIQSRANLDAQSGRKQRTALSFASSPSNNGEPILDAVRLLMAARADPTAADCEGLTPAGKAKNECRHELLAVVDVKQE